MKCNEEIRKMKKKYVNISDQRGTTLSLERTVEGTSDG
jgi:hypothetical protein